VLVIGGIPARWTPPPHAHVSMLGGARWPSPMRALRRRPRGALCAASRMRAPQRSRCALCGGLPRCALWGGLDEPSAHLPRCALCGGSPAELSVRRAALVVGGPMEPSVRLPRPYVAARWNPPRVVPRSWRRPNGALRAFRRARRGQTLLSRGDFFFEKRVNEWTGRIMRG
jgi:hypothetical protein